ncbi:MAG: pentapeptide repeat-containing protein [Leptolyngbya sp. SIO1E4]|nr:pentapeptide repeat-containing protein [Leptolyngbya sp. SIO1E4]
MGWRSSLIQRLEKWLQRVPTWLAVLVSVLCLAVIALWVQEDVVIRSPRDLLRRSVINIFFENAESFAIVAAVILYFKSAPDRKAQKHYEAWRIIDNAAAAQLTTSYARFRALEDLHKDGVPLRSLEAPAANLSQIQLPHAQLVEANLPGADLREANLHGADLSRAQLQGANFQHANLRGANLQNVNLQNANLRDADLTGANLQNADLKGASLRSAELWKTQFLGANLADAELKWAELQGAELNGAKLSRTIMPDGSVERQAIEYWVNGL